MWRLRRRCRLRAQIEALPHQADLVDDETSDVVVLTGGLRAGKTVAAVLKALRLGIVNYPTPTLIVEPTFKMIDDVFIRTARGVFNKAGIPYRYYDAKKLLTVNIGGRTIEYIMRTAERPEHIYGFTAGAAIVDEWETCSEEAVKAAAERITHGAPGVTAPQLILVGTPEGFGFGYEWTEKKPLPNLRLIRARTVDNPHVGAKYVENATARMSEAEARERLEGIRTPKEGRVYTRFSRHKHHRDAPSDWTQLGGKLEVWADFNVGLMCWAVVHILGDVAHVIDEIIGYDTDALEQTLRTRRYFAEHLHTTEREIMQRHYALVCDASGANRSAATPLTMVMTANGEGFRAKFPAANPAVADRVASVQAALAYDKLFIDTRRCSYVTRCLEQQGRAPNGEPAKNNANPKEDLSHGSDAVGYGIFFHWPAYRPRANQVTGGLRAIG